MKNIVFILSDQHNPAVMGSAGDPYVRTPNLDRLAAGGTRFDRTYCSSPVCVPSRMSLLAGRHISDIGVTDNTSNLASDVPTFVHSMGLAGYHTVLAGRMHFMGPDQRHGFHERLIGDITGTAIGGRGVPYGPELRGLSGQGGPVVNKSGAGRSSLIAYDEAVTRDACGYIDSYDKEEPLFMTVGHYAPHCPYVCPEELFDYYYEKLPVPEMPENFKETVHPAVKKWYEHRNMDVVTPDGVRRARAAYYGLVELLDGYIGQILESIDTKLGLDNTLVIYASDHGDMIGENGLWWKNSMYEGSVHVPMIWHAPGDVPAGSSIGQPTSLLDLAPSLIDFAGGTPLPEMHGENILPLVKGDVPENFDRAVVALNSQNWWNEFSAMARKNEWKLVVHGGYEVPQLFNLNDDPQEQHDLGGDPQYAGIIAELRQHLAPHWDYERIRAAAEKQRSAADFMRAWAAKFPEQVASEFWPGADVEKDNYLKSISN